MPLLAVFRVYAKAYRRITVSIASMCMGIGFRLSGLKFRPLLTTSGPVTVYLIQGRRSP